MEIDPFDQNEPVPRGEYERRHAALQHKYETFSRRVGWTLAVFALAILLTGGAAAWLIQQNVERSEDIQDSLVKSCESSGNPLREANTKFGQVLAGQLQDAVVQSKTFERSGVYAQFFPAVAPGELHQLLAKSRREKSQDKAEIEQALEDLRPVDCEAKF